MLPRPTKWRTFRPLLPNGGGVLQSVSPVANKYDPAASKAKPDRQKCTKAKDQFGNRVRLLHQSRIVKPVGCIYRSMRDEILNFRRSSSMKYCATSKYSSGAQTPGLFAFLRINCAAIDPFIDVQAST